MLPVHKYGFIFFNLLYLIEPPLPLPRGGYCRYQFTGRSFVISVTYPWHAFPSNLHAHNAIINCARCAQMTTHCLSVQRVWGVLIFLLTFFIKEKSECPPHRRNGARLAKPCYETKPLYPKAQLLYLRKQLLYLGQRPFYNRHKRRHSRLTHASHYILQL